jgi:dolichol-phosphate mannosyltransferase
MVENPQISIIIPTLNEAGNISLFIKDIIKCMKNQPESFEMLVVDDNSKDGTIEIVSELIQTTPNLRLIIRKELILPNSDEKVGVSAAVLRGFKEGKGKIFCVIDADFSHPIEAIPRLYNPILNETADFCIGSRYIDNGGIENWTLGRKIVSSVAKFFAKIITRVKDPLAGFFAIHRTVIDKSELKSVGNKIVLEFIARGTYKSLLEVPIIFTDRNKGKSKLDSKVMILYLYQLLLLLMAKNSRSRQWVQFCLVGASGTLVNMATLYLLVEWGGIYYILGALFSAILSMCSNFFLNKHWTFKSHTIRSTPIAFQKVIVTTIISILLNLILLYTFTEFFHIWYLVSQILAIILVMLWNYFSNKSWVFKHESNQEKLNQ